MGITVKVYYEKNELIFFVVDKNVCVFSFTQEF